MLRESKNVQVGDTRKHNPVHGPESWKPPKGDRPVHALSTRRPRVVHASSTRRPRVVPTDGTTAIANAQLIRIYLAIIDFPHAFSDPEAPSAACKPVASPVQQLGELHNIPVIRRGVASGACAE